MSHWRTHPERHIGLAQFFAVLMIAGWLVYISILIGRLFISEPSIHNDEQFISARIR
jgi:hypothetical protein